MAVLQLPQCESTLDLGLYCPTEVSLYTGIPVGSLQSWVHGLGHRKSVIEAQLDRAPQWITFIDMVQAMAIRDLREEGIPMTRIRQAIRYVQKRRPEIRYPLATRHETYVIETTRNVAILFSDEDTGVIQQASGDHQGQYVHAGMLDRYLHKMSFGADNVATLYTPVAQRGCQITLDPRVRSGQPIVQPCGYMAETLVHAYVSEGNSVCAAAEAYEVAPEAVELAVTYMDDPKRYAA